MSQLLVRLKDLGRPGRASLQQLRRLGFFLEPIEDVIPACRTACSAGDPLSPSLATGPLFSDGLTSGVGHPGQEAAR
jgi:hypothetical protein